MRRLSRIAALLMAAFLIPALAQAGWLPGGNRIGAGTGHDEIFVAAASGPDRVVVAWVRRIGPFDRQVRAQAWTADGELVPGWPEEGVEVSGVLAASLSITITDDGAGGAFIAWATGNASSVHLQHVAGSGSVTPGWPADGLLLGPGAPFPQQPLAPDGVGGVFAARWTHRGGEDFGVVVHRIDATGAPAAGWPADGLWLPHMGAAAVMTDAGHVYVSASEYDPLLRSTIGLRVKRLDGSGAPDPSWPPDGALLSGARGSPEVFADGSGGVFVGWYRASLCPGFCPPEPGYLASRVLDDGTPDLRWAAGRAAFSLSPDRAGGMLLGMVDRGRPAVARLDATGTPLAGWAAEGNAAMTESVYPHRVLVTGDGRGGAFVVWQDTRSGEGRLYASRLDASGRRAEGWPATASLVDAARGWPFPTELLTLREDLAIVVWQEASSPYDGSTGFLTSLRPGAPGPLAPLAPFESEVGFGIRPAAANPARGPILAVVELPAGGPARLDLLDATGRIVETQEYAFRTQARGTVRFDRAGALPAGIYWLRVSQAGRTATHKFAVLR